METSSAPRCCFLPVFLPHLNPGLFFSGFVLTLPVSRGVWEGPNPVAFLHFRKQREAGVGDCGCLQSVDADLESACQPSVLPPWLSPRAQSWGEPCHLLELRALSKVILVQPSVGKLLTRVGQVSQWLPPHFPS